MKARLVLLCGVVALASGCMGDNQLAGSVSSLFPLDVSIVEVLRNDQAFQVSYYANRGADVDIVARVTVSLYQVEVKNGVRIPLNGEAEAGHARCTVMHMAAGEPARFLPTIKLGDLVLEAGGNPDEPARGHFSMSFYQGDTYGAGRTLQGTFNVSKTKDAGYGP